MTSVASIVTGNSVYVITDGAIFDEATGNLRGTVSKVHIAPDKNAVMVQRGGLQIGYLVWLSLADCSGGFDDLRARLPDKLKKAFSTVPQQQIPDFDILVAGFSETGGPSQYVMRCKDHPNFAELKAWTPVDPGNVWIAPGTGEVYRSIDVEKFDPERDGVRVIEQQRHIKDPGYIVGGFAQLTQVTRNQITTKILKRWPDKIGQPINPTV